MNHNNGYLIIRIFVAINIQRLNNVIFYKFRLISIEISTSVRTYHQHFFAHIPFSSSPAQDQSRLGGRQRHLHFRRPAHQALRYAAVRHLLHPVGAEPHGAARRRRRTAVRRARRLRVRLSGDRGAVRPGGLRAHAARPSARLQRGQTESGR